MNNRKGVITRRDFIRTGSCVAMGSLMGLPLMSHTAKASPMKSRVVLIRDKNIFNVLGEINNSRLEDMLDVAVKAALEAPDAASAWRKLIRPDDIVGIKSNVWGYLPTPDGLERPLQGRRFRSGWIRKTLGWMIAVCEDIRFLNGPPH